MITAGVDIGSITSKTVILENGNLNTSNVIRTGARSKYSAEKSLSMALSSAKLNRNDIDYIVSTGYGRANLDCADKHVTEITCHGVGASYLFPGTRTVIDIGGQDSKAISLNEKGEILNFVMNDKCAAGTGRFLEVMSHTLEIELNKLGGISILSNNELEISSMCTVFAESEVVSLIAEGYFKEDIAKALHNSAARRILNMTTTIGIKEPVTLSGGVINNIGMIIAIKNMLDVKVNIPKEPQIVGALGAAVIAYKHYLKISDLGPLEEITYHGI